MRVGRVNALLNPLTFVVVNLAIVALIWAGGWRVQAGALTQGQIVALVNYMNQILLALVVVANLVVIFTRAAASAVRVPPAGEAQDARRSPCAARHCKAGVLGLSCPALQPQGQGSARPLHTDRKITSTACRR